MAAGILGFGGIGLVGRVTGMIEKAIHIASGHGAGGDIVIIDAIWSARFGRMSWTNKRSHSVWLGKGKAVFRNGMHAGLLGHPFEK